MREDCNYSYLRFHEVYLWDFNRLLGSVSIVGTDWVWKASVSGLCPKLVASWKILILLFGFYA